MNKLLWILFPVCGIIFENIFKGDFIGFKAVLFDLDGTLVDSIAHIASSMNAALSELGLPGHTVREYGLLVGYGRNELIRKALGTVHGDDLFLELRDRFRRIHDENHLENTPAFEGILELVDELSAAGLKLGIVTNKTDYLAEALAEKLFPGRFDAVCGTRDGFPEKPDPFLAETALNALGIAPCDTLFVGDSDVDVYTAHNAGMSAVGVSWGFRGRQELDAAGAEYIIEKPKELLELVKGTVQIKSL